MMATSLIIGLATRNENVTPSGTPLSTKPMNSGTAEQEQNGVTTPSSAAATLPAYSRECDRSLRVLSGEKNERMIATKKMTTASRMSTFGTSKRKKSTDMPTLLVAESP